LKSQFLSILAITNETLVTLFLVFHNMFKHVPSILQHFRSVIDVVFHLKMAHRGRNMLWKTKNKVTRVSVVIVGILRKCDNITQQDAPYKNKIPLKCQLTFNGLYDITNYLRDIFILKHDMR
jgi:hypothetical protein